MKKSLCFGVPVLVFLLATVCSLCTSCGAPAFTRRTQDRITKAVENAMLQYGSPGAIVGIWQKGKGQYAKAFGKASLADDKPMKADDLWKVASITKTYTANVILQLAEERRLGLDDRLSKFDWSDGLANADRITLRMLLNHTSGYPDLENDDPEFQKVRFGNPTKVWTHKEILDWGRTLVPLFPPGQGYHYTNFGYYLLGMTIESVTGGTVGGEIQKRIADKLGLKNTRLADMPAYLLGRPHSNGYVLRNELPEGITVPGTDPIVDTVRWNTTAGWTSAGVDSDLMDLKTWIESVAAGSLLSPAMHAEQIKNPVPMSGAKNTPCYGLGVAMMNMPGGELYWHNGATLGYSSFAGSLADNSLTVIVFMNVMPGADQEDTSATKLATPLMAIVQEGGD